MLTNQWCQSSQASYSPEVARNVGRKIQYLLLLHHSEVGCLVSKLREQCIFFYGEDLIPEKTKDVELVCTLMLDDYVSLERDLNGFTFVKPKSLGLTETKKVIEEFVVPYLEQSKDATVSKNYVNTKPTEHPLDPKSNEDLSSLLELSNDYLISGFSTPDITFLDDYSCIQPGCAMPETELETLGTPSRQDFSVCRNLSEEFAASVTQAVSATTYTNPSPTPRDERVIEGRETCTSDFNLELSGENLPFIQSVPSYEVAISTVVSTVSQDSMLRSSEFASTPERGNTGDSKSLKRRSRSTKSHCAAKSRKMGEPVNSGTDSNRDKASSPSQSPKSCRRNPSASRIRESNMLQKTLLRSRFLRNNDDISNELDRGVSNSCRNHSSVTRESAPSLRSSEDFSVVYDLDDKILNKKDRYIRPLGKKITYQMEIKNIANWTCIVSNGCDSRFFFVCPSESESNVTYKISWKANSEWKWFAVPDLYLPRGTVIFGEFLNCATDRTILNIVDVSYVGGENIGHLKFKARREKCMQFFRQLHGAVTTSYNIVWIKTSSPDELPIILHDLHNHSRSFSIDKEDILVLSSSWPLFNFQVKEILFLKVKLAGNREKIANFRSVMMNRVCWKWNSDLELDSAAKIIQRKGGKGYPEKLLAYMRKTSAII